ncbi:MAG: DUF3500 domain-containing protein [Planctomycetota bacterium]|nr:DUF3500 domain-containing protein [Planctomycetota bacterium]
MRIARSLLTGSLLVAIAFVIGQQVAAPPAAQMKTFADAFLATLDQDQQAIAQIPYGSEKRVDWHFIPKKSRKGLVIREMNQAQRTAALRLVRAALSELGYDKTQKIMMLEGVLRELEGEGRNWERDPEKYYVTIFGTPTNTGSWGMSFEGHHLSLNFVCRDGQIVDSTPQFFAANPATVMNDVTGPLGKGTRVLRNEESLAFELVNALNPSQARRAILSDTAPKEIRFAGEPQAEVGEPEGISQRELNEDQQALLKKLVYTYTNATTEKVAAERRGRIDKNGWEDIHFAWAGPTKPGIGHYYRVRGKEFLIEFVNTQPDAAGNPANHIHCVWRDLTGDFDLPNK